MIKAPSGKNRTPSETWRLQDSSYANVKGPFAGQQNKYGTGVKVQLIRLWQRYLKWEPRKKSEKSHICCLEEEEEDWKFMCEG